MSSFEKDLGKLKEKVEEEMQVFKATLHGQCLCPEDLIQAESAVISFSQRRKFKEELSVQEKWCQKKQSFVQSGSGVG